MSILYLLLIVFADVTDETFSPNPVFSAVSGLEFAVSKDHRECKLSTLTVNV